MTAPVDEFPWLTPEEFELLTVDEQDLYLRAAQAEMAERQHEAQPVPDSPGAIADLITGGTELHPAHLKLVDEAYQQMARGEIDRLLITMPPQHGKSSRSRWGSLYWLTRRQQDRIVVASAGLDLAREHARWVRNTIEARPELQLQIARDRRSAQAWDLKGQRGGMYAVGIGGSLTGRPADLLVLDDPVKDAESVDKREQRDKLWSWWSTVASTRLSPNASVVVIMTRWHEDDIAGRILAGPDRARWRVLHLPALADEDDDLLGRGKGDALWPARYSREWLLNQTASGTMSSRQFSALYQGRPVPDGGSLFKRHWLRIVDDWPREARLLRFWDLAATEDTGSGDPDWTVGALVAEYEGLWWVLDVVRFRGSPHEVKRRMAATRDMDGWGVPVRVEQEPGSSGKIVVHDLATTVYRGYDFRGRPATGSKLTRANPLAAAAEAGNVAVLRGEWADVLLDEFESFPYGAHDDQVDAVAGAMNWLAVPDQEEHMLVRPRWATLSARR